MIILGIDPGLSITGWGLLRRTDSADCSVIDHGAIHTSSQMKVSERIKIIYDAICGLITTYSPDVMAVEKLFFIHNTSSRLAVGQARGVMLLAAEQKKIPIYEYAPKEVKLAVTGYGSAGKDQVSHMIKSLLRLAQIPKPDDVADALAIALCHANSFTIKNLQGAGR